MIFRNNYPFLLCPDRQTADARFFKSSRLSVWRPKLLLSFPRRRESRYFIV